MRRKFALIATLPLMLMLFSGFLCGQVRQGDDCSQGVTGGDTDGGYGTFGTNLDTGYDGPYILGNWRQDQPQGEYRVVVFNSDNSLRFESFTSSGQQLRSQTGNYNISGNRIDLDVMGWVSGSWNYEIQGSRLTLSKDGEVQIFDRPR